MNNTFRTLAAQLNLTVGDLVGNREKIRAAWQQGKDEDANLVVTTELSLCGYPPEDELHSTDFLNAVEDELQQLVASTASDGPSLIVGAPLRFDGQLYNCAVVIKNGKITDIIRKNHLPNYGVFDEKRYFTAGGMQEPVTIDGVKIGLMVCEDTWFSDVSQNLKDKGAELLISINASPFELEKEKTRLNDVVAARAHETGLPLLYVNQLGGHDEVVFDGDSIAVDATGQQTYQAPMWQEKIDLITWDRNSSGAWEPKGPMASLPDKWEDLYSALVLATRDYLHKNGRKQVVLGLSGGADSTLVAAIAADALGPENVHCIRMPSQYTSDMSNNDAAEFSKNLGCHLHTAPIKNIVLAFLESVADMFKIFKTFKGDTTEENIQARIRGSILMMFTNRTGSLLLSTGNKSEVAVGYCTLYGDMNGGYNPLKDVYKTDVYELLKWRNQHTSAIGLGPAGAIIPERVITRPASAELAPGQEDEKALMPYPRLDFILRRYIDQKMPVAKVHQEYTSFLTTEYGTDTTTAFETAINDIQRIVDLVHQAEFKRQQACPGPKVSGRSFRRERRNPIINKYKPDVRAAVTQQKTIRTPIQLG